MSGVLMTRFDESADLIFPLKGTEPCRAAARQAENLGSFNIYLNPQRSPWEPSDLGGGGEGGAFDEDVI